jgi:hypothetical protein
MANYVLNENKMYADIADGIAIVINSETGIYYGMNTFGTAVFENIRNGVSTEKLLAEIKQFSGAPADIETRFELFLNAMIDKELIIEGGNEDNKINIDLKTAQDDNFVLDIREYNDAQELLLADPIHEVKEEMGWTPEKESLNPDKEDVARREAKSIN